MPREKELSNEENAQIRSLHDLRKSCRCIGTSINRNPSTVSRYLSMIKNNHPKKKRSGKPRAALSDREKSSMRKVITKDRSISIKKLIQSCNLGCSEFPVRCYIKSPWYFKLRPAKFPNITVKITKKRVEVCVDWLKQGINWQKVWFSGEKRWCFDGPYDGIKYWINTNKPRVVRKKRQVRGVSGMMWAYIEYNMKSKIVWISGNMNSHKYGEMMDATVIQDRNWLGSDDVIF